jgi:alkanesulfonate monooxygenase SsuD/methylene tetrahydromethanopterin reductase-like flavin-dependent oxidoreductase (luciferase family)
VAAQHLGLILPNYGDALEAERLASVAIAAEEAGFDSGWVTDHVIVPPEHAPIYGRIAEALVSLGFLAGRTRRLQIGVSALVVPQRNPLVVLKQLATLDFLSGGRLVTPSPPAGWRASSGSSALTSSTEAGC